jgi:5-methylcytosine-specific restriction endonuclease McrA
MERRTLLLNATFEPLKIISWQRAIALWFEDKVEIVESYDDFELKSQKLTMKCPAVVRLIEFVKSHRNKVKFSRANVFGRDKYMCQYCGDTPGTEDLTYDHVLPRSKGGKTEWTNIVTCCVDCNKKKADRTPEQAKMKLMTQPRKPDLRPESVIRMTLPTTPDEWRNYLYWNQSLQEG